VTPEELNEMAESVEEEEREEEFGTKD